MAILKTHTHKQVTVTQDRYIASLKYSMVGLNGLVIEIPDPAMWAPFRDVLEGKLPSVTLCAAF